MTDAGFRPKIVRFSVKLLDRIMGRPENAHLLFTDSPTEDMKAALRQEMTDFDPTLVKGVVYDKIVEETFVPGKDSLQRDWDYILNAFTNVTMEYALRRYGRGTTGWFLENAKGETLF